MGRQNSTSLLWCGRRTQPGATHPHTQGNYEVRNCLPTLFRRSEDWMGDGVAFQLSYYAAIFRAGQRASRGGAHYGMYLVRVRAIVKA